MTPLLQTWARALVVTLGLVMLAVVAVMIFAVVVIVMDESSHGEDWDGFGTFLGLIALAIGAVHLVVLVGAWLVLRAARRAGSRLGTGIAGGISLVLSVPWFVLAVASQEAEFISIACPAAGAAIVVGLGTIVVAAQPAQKPRDQPPAWPQPPKSS